MEEGDGEARQNFGTGWMKKPTARQIVSLVFALLLMAYLAWGAYKRLITDPGEKYGLAFVVFLLAFMASFTLIRPVREFVIAHVFLFRAAGIVIAAVGVLELYAFWVDIPLVGLDVSVWWGFETVLFGYLIATMPNTIKRYGAGIAAINK